MPEGVDEKLESASITPKKPLVEELENEEQQQERKNKK